MEDSAVTCKDDDGAGDIKMVSSTAAVCSETATAAIKTSNDETISTSSPPSETRFNDHVTITSCDTARVPSTQPIVLTQFHESMTTTAALGKDVSLPPLETVYMLQQHPASTAAAMMHAFTSLEYPTTAIVYAQPFSAIDSVEYQMADGVETMATNQLLITGGADDQSSSTDVKPPQELQQQHQHQQTMFIELPLSFTTAAAPHHKTIHSRQQPQSMHPHAIQFGNISPSVSAQWFDYGQQQQFSVHPQHTPLTPSVKKMKHERDDFHVTTDDNGNQLTTVMLQTESAAIEQQHHQQHDDGSSTQHRFLLPTSPSNDNMNSQPYAATTTILPANAAYVAAASLAEFVKKSVVRSQQQQLRGQLVSLVTTNDKFDAIQLTDVLAGGQKNVESCAVGREHETLNVIYIPSSTASQLSGLVKDEHSAFTSSLSAADDQLIVRRSSLQQMTTAGDEKQHLTSASDHQLQHSVPRHLFTNLAPALLNHEQLATAATYWSPLQQQQYIAIDDNENHLSPAVVVAKANAAAAGPPLMSTLSIVDSKHNIIACLPSSTVISSAITAKTHSSLSPSLTNTITDANSGGQMSADELEKQHLQTTKPNDAETDDNVDESIRRLAGVTASKHALSQSSLRHLPMSTTIIKTELSTSSSSDIVTTGVSSRNGGGVSSVVLSSAVRSRAKSEGPRMFHCSECEETFLTRHDLRKHTMMNHASNDPEPAELIVQTYRCPMNSCDFATTKRDKLDRHMAQHVSDGYTPAGTKRSNKANPQRLKYDAEEYHCPLCPYRCTVEKSFKKHQKMHHESGQSSSIVDAAAESVDPQTMTAAVATTMIMSFSCPICGKDRATEQALSKHIGKHRQGKLYCCDECSFQSIQLKKVIQHRRMHTGEKPHLCPFCAYRSARRDNLRSHVRSVHKKENVYSNTFNPKAAYIAAIAAGTASTAETTTATDVECRTTTVPQQCENNNNEQTTNDDCQQTIAKEEEQSIIETSSCAVISHLTLTSVTSQSSST